MDRIKNAATFVLARLFESACVSVFLCAGASILTLLGGVLIYGLDRHCLDLANGVARYAAAHSLWVFLLVLFAMTARAIPVTRSHFSGLAFSSGASGADVGPRDCWHPNQFQRLDEEQTVMVWHCPDCGSTWDIARDTDLNSWQEPSK